MKYLFLIFLLSVTNAYSRCVDLSHKTKLGAADVEVRQLGCESLSRQMFIEGEPVGESSTVKLNGEWLKDSVDDENERFSRQIRWKWNKEKTVLTYEYFVVSYAKDSGDESVLNGTHIYSIDDLGISLEKYSQSKVVSRDGKVKVNQSHVNESLKPL